MGTTKMSGMNIYYRFKVKMPAKQHLTLAHLLQHPTTCKLLNGHWVWKVFNATPIQFYFYKINLLKLHILTLLETQQKNKNPFKAETQIISVSVSILRL